MYPGSFQPEDESFGTPPDLGAQGEVDSALEEDVRAVDLDLSIDWPRERRERLARRLDLQIEDYYTATEQKRGDLEQHRREVELMPRDANDGPFDQSSDVMPGLVRKSVNAHHSRLNQQILLLDPPMAVVAREEAAIEAAPRIEEALPAILEEAEWAVHGDEAHGELPVAGSCFMSLTWERRVEPRPFLQGDYDEETAQALAQAGVDPVTAGVSALKTNARGELKRELAFRDEVVYDGLRFRVIRWEDGLVLPATATRMEEACAIGERVVILGEELLFGAQEGRYLRDAVDELLQKRGDPPTEDQRKAWENQGVDPPANDYGDLGWSEDGYPEAALARTYLCHEMCVKLQVKPRMRPIWCWVTLHRESKLILRLQHLPWLHGEPHYHLLTYYRRAGQLWGGSVAEMLSGHQDAYGAILNQRIDRGELANNLKGNFFYDDRADYDPDEQDFVLGQGIKVGRIEGIQQIQMPDADPDQLRLMEILKQDADLLTGASDPALGKEAAGQHTLGEIQIAMGAGNLHFENLAAAVARQHARLWDQARWLAAQYGDKGRVKYRKSASAGARIQIDDATGQVLPVQEAPVADYSFESISAQMLRANVDLVPAGLQHNSDIQSRIQVAQVVFNTVMALPVAQANPRILITALDYFLQVLRFPPRRRLMSEVEQAVGIQAQQMALQAAALQQQQAGAAEADVASKEAALQGGAAADGVPPELLMAGGGGMTAPPAGMPA